MEQTSTLSHDDVLKTPQKSPTPMEEGQEPSARVLQNILDFSRNLEVNPSKLLKHVSFLRS